MATAIPFTAADKARSLFYWLWFAAISVVMNLVWLPSLLLPRPILLRGLIWWSQATLWGLKFFTGITHEIRGAENIPATPALFAVKHLSMWETLALVVLLKDPAAVLKRELKSVPFYGWYAARLGMIFVDRDAHASALKAMVKDAREALAQNRSIIIFPEGTRVDPCAVPDYKPGVAALYNALQVPCVPVALNSGIFWPRSGFWRRPGKIVIEFLPPIHPGLKRPVFMAELQKVIEGKTAALLAEGKAQVLLREDTPG